MGWFGLYPKKKIVPVNNPPVNHKTIPVNHEQYKTLMSKHKNKLTNAIKKGYLLGKNKKTKIKNLTEITPETYKNVIVGTYNFYDLYNNEATEKNIPGLLNRIIANRKKENENRRLNSFKGPNNINRNNLTNKEKMILRALYNNSIKINGINLNSARKVKNVHIRMSTRNGNHNIALTGSPLYRAYRREAKKLAK